MLPLIYGRSWPAAAAQQPAPWEKQCGSPDSSRLSNLRSGSERERVAVHAEHSPLSVCARAPATGWCVYRVVSPCCGRLCRDLQFSHNSLVRPPARLPANLARRNVPNHIVTDQHNEVAINPSLHDRITIISVPHYVLLAQWQWCCNTYGRYMSQLGIA